MSQVFDHMFPSGLDWPMATVAPRAKVLADRLGASLDTWEVDGLGTAHGFFFQLPSGRVVLLKELEHSVEHFGAPGPGIYVDGGQAATEGLEALLAEALTAMDLDARAVYADLLQEHHDPRGELILLQIEIARARAA